MTCPTEEGLRRLAVRLREAQLGAGEVSRLPDTTPLADLINHLEGCQLCRTRLDDLLASEATPEAGAWTDRATRPARRRWRSVPTSRWYGFLGRRQRSSDHEGEEDSFHLAAEGDQPERTPASRILHVASSDGRHHIKILPSKQGGAVGFLLTESESPGAVIGLEIKGRPFRFNRSGQVRLPVFPEEEVRILLRES